MSTIPNELATNLPPRIEELTQAIAAGNTAGDGSPVSYHLAETVEALHRCDVCARPIVEAEMLAEALARHYDAGEEDRGRLIDAIRASDLETGDLRSPNYCSYHGQITAGTS